MVLEDSYLNGGLVVSDSNNTIRVDKTLINPWVSSKITLPATREKNKDKLIKSDKKSAQDVF